MHTKDVYEMLKKKWKDFPFKYQDTKNGIGSITCFFHNNKRDIKFFLDLWIIKDNLILDFNFGRVDNFNTALYYVNEFNKATLPCFKAAINNGPRGDFFHIGYLVGVKDLDDVSARLLQAMDEIVKDSTYNYIKPLYDSLIDQNNPKSMA